MAKTALDSYASRTNQHVGGWLARIDAEIMRCILVTQNDEMFKGAVVEVGVHEGKSFILLCLAIKDNETAYCIDIFEDQALNIDNSGRGNRAVLEKNLAKFLVAPERVVIDARSSELVRADDILAKVGPVRFFSVDGGHWLNLVVNDLKLAEASLALEGVIALDDFFRPEWPDVSAGYFKWFSGRGKPIVPFAIGFNKLYLCDEQHVNLYQGSLRNNEIAPYLISKECSFQGFDVIVFEKRLLPEHGVKDWCKAYLRLYYPEKLAVAKRVLTRKIDGRHML